MQQVKVLSDKEFDNMIARCPEIVLYMTITQLTDCINDSEKTLRLSRYDLTGDEVEYLQKRIDQAMIRSVKAVKQTKRFGITEPIGRYTGRVTHEYLSWYQRWDRYMGEMSDDEIQEIIRQKNENGDLSQYNPPAQPLTLE